MRRTKYILAILIFAPQLTIEAQLPSPDELLKTVLENNKEIRSAREAYRTSLVESGTGITPPDPEVEFGYLYGKPAEMGNRIDFRVSQQLDFPTSYIHQSQIRKIKDSRAEIRYEVIKQDVLLRSHVGWIERLYLNQLERLMTSRIKQSSEIQKQLRQKLDLGEIAQLAYDQSTLQRVALESEYDEVLTKIRSNRVIMQNLAGGIEFPLEDTIFPIPISIEPDSLLQAYDKSPTMRSYLQAVDLKEKQKDLSISQYLPRLSAGYYSESVLDQQFKGVQMGFTIPLWENSNRIKHAKSEIIQAESNSERFYFEQRKILEQKLLDMESLNSRIARLEDLLDKNQSMNSLNAALEEGEISLTDFFYSSDLYFRNEMLLLRYKRDRLITEAELRKIFL
jgi:outer membrane protein TolC